MPEVGELSESPSVPKVVMWTIPDFAGLPRDSGYFVASRNFQFDGTVWRLMLFPNGLGELVGCAMLTLSPSARYFRSSVMWELKVKHRGGAPLKTHAGTLGDLRSDRIETKSLLVTHELLIRQCLHADGSLRLFCKLGYDEERRKNVATQTEANPRTEKLVQNLRELLYSQENSDVTIRVRGEEFKVHRSILGARTPVFASMFHHEMAEKTTGVVTIDDCDADAFRTFLHYVYVGTAEDISTRNVFNLHQVADKYQLDELKAECLEYIKTNLSADTLCDALLVGLTYEEQELTDMARKFLSEHKEDISTRNVFNLHQLADKYHLDELKAECLEYMKTNLSADTLCDVLLVGLTYEEQELTDMARKFLSEHKEDVTVDEKWLKFQSDNPELSTQLLLEAVRVDN